MKSKAIPFLTLAGALLAVWPAPALAQDDDVDESRGVARLSLMNGDVSVRRGDSGDWVAAAINAPLLAGDHVYNGPGARAEVQFDYYDRIRLAEETEINLSQLEYRRFQIQVVRGTVTFSAIKGSDAQVEVSTPAAAVRPVDQGRYRVTVRPDGTVEITVRQGEAEIYTPKGTQRLRGGSTMLVRDTGSGEPEFQMVAAIPRDSWDEFNESRDHELERARTQYQYVSRDIYGAEDLYGYGDWTYVTPYGYCWRPYVAAGWAPYRYGRWTWMDWYGWSWVSYDPWGWAPYHYGRWFWNAGAWCWYPGAMFGVHHYWRPALVAWFGWSGRGGFSLGVGFGSLGWVPLAPFEPFHPWWGHRYYAGFSNRTTIINNIHVINNTNIYNTFRNARVTNGVTVMDGRDFGRGTTGRAMRANEAQLQRAGLVQGALPMTPQRESLRFSDREVRSSAMPRSSGTQERFFSARRDTPSVQRVPFEQQRQAMEQATGRGFSGNRGDSTRAGQGNARQAETRGVQSESPRAAIHNAEVSPRESGTQAGGQWSRFGDPRSATSGRTATQESRGGWRTMGEPSRSGDAGSTTGSTFQSRTGRGGDTPSGNGWRSFGNPGTGSTAGESSRPIEGGAARSGGWSTTGEGTRGSSPGNEPSRTMDRGGWSTGGGSRSVESPRSEVPRSESPRTFDRGSWSTGGDRSSSPQSVSPRYSAPSPRMESPRHSAPSPRMESPRYSAPAPRMESPRYSAPAPRMESPRGGGGSIGGGGGRIGGGGGGTVRGGGGGGRTRR